MSVYSNDASSQIICCDYFEVETDQGIEIVPRLSRWKDTVLTRDLDKYCDGRPFALYEPLQVKRGYLCRLYLNNTLGFTGWRAFSTKQEADEFVALLQSGETVNARDMREKWRLSEQGVVWLVYFLTIFAILLLLLSI